ncbi:MAG: hypothetical protein EXR71_13300 [Myxococcales bacterium]|nr:hypothetical protein [Myxococcales bacterium]
MSLLLTLLGCSTVEEEVPFSNFADIFEPGLTVNAGEIPPGGKRLQVLVSPAREGACRALPKLRADLDGLPLTRLHGKVDHGAFKYDRDCFAYEFEGKADLIAQVSGKPENVITVTDGVTTLSLTATNLFVETTMVVESATVRAGADVTLRLVPGGDVVDAAVPVAIDIHAEGRDLVSVAAVVAGDLLTVPMPAGSKGKATLDLMGTRAFQPVVTTCVGTRSCSASRAFIVPTLAVDVQ